MLEMETVIITGIVFSIAWVIILIKIISVAVKSGTNSASKDYQLKKMNYLLERLLIEQGVDINQVKITEIGTDKLKTLTMDEYIEFRSINIYDRFKMVK